MKKMICILLALLLFAVPVLAEEAPLAESESPFGPYVLTAPEGVTIEAGEASHTFVSGMTRVVAMYISRVPDADPAEAVIRMMPQFDPQAVIGEDIPMAEGFVGLEALAQDKLGEGVDQLTVMVLSSTGDLLIFSGYDMQGDESAVQTLLDALLNSLTVDDAKIVLTKE